MRPLPADSNSQRLDTWLWAARFFKTRSLAQAAINGGKVRVNGHPAKPAREVRRDDRLNLTLPDSEREIIVLGFNAQRRPAPEAQALYAETPESLARRTAERSERSLAPTPGSERKGRPTKRDRRKLEQFGG